MNANLSQIDAATLSGLRKRVPTTFAQTLLYEPHGTAAGREMPNYDPEKLAFAILQGDTRQR